LIAAIAANTLRECFRRPFPYIVAATVALLALGSQLLRPAAFGEASEEVSNLLVSAAFLAALANTALIGTTLVRADLERGTLGLILSQPVGALPYLAGRFLGLALGTLAVCGMAAIAAGAALTLGGAHGLLASSLLFAITRVMLAAVVLSAAALAVSAVATRLLGPVLLVGLFLAGDVAGASPIGNALPRFGLFSFEVGQAPPAAWLFLYASLLTVVFLLVTYLLMTVRPLTRTES
jgi:Cu-processing system permease protein